VATSDAARFNPYHAKAGSSAGGQFSSSSGGGGGSSAKAPGGHAALPPGGSHDAAHTPRERLLAEAHADEQRARELEKELHALQHQHHAAAAAAKHHAAQAAAAGKAGHAVHHQHHHAAHHRHKKHASTLHQRIMHLKAEIHHLREHAADLEKQAHASRAGGAVTNPSGTERLHEYWVHGEGAAKIRWGQPGDFDRCVLHLGKFIKDPKGYCNLAHHAALGIYPATHAAMEHKAGRSQVSEPAYDADGLDGSWDGDCSDLPDLTGLDVSHFEAADGDTEPAAASRAKPKLGSGARFKKLKSSLAAKGAHDPGALAAYIGRKKYGKGKFMKLASKARGASRSDDGQPPPRAEFVRMYPLENIEILRSEKDADGHQGAIVEAYAAVFGQAAEIKDHEGHYIEEIDRGAFDTAIAFAERNTGGLAGNIKVLYNHGMTVQGTPAPEFQLPIGVPIDIKPEERGLLTRTRYDAEDPFVQRLLGKIRQGSITSQSFVGRIIRSDPQLRRGDRHRPDSTGSLRTVRRMKLGLREYGPVLWPAYSGAEILGVRMSTPGGVLDPDEENDAQALPPDEGPAFADPLPEEEHSARYHQHALFVLRAKEAREKAGLVW